MSKSINMKSESIKRKTPVADAEDEGDFFASLTQVDSKIVTKSKKDSKAINWGEDDDNDLSDIEMSSDDDNEDLDENEISNKSKDKKVTEKVVKKVESGAAAHKALRKQKLRENALKQGIRADPSLMYFHTPTATPIIKEATQFFETMEPSAYRPGPEAVVSLHGKQVPSFSVHMATDRNWRTHAKLAVRTYGLGYVSSTVADAKAKASNNKNDDVFAKYITKKKESDAEESESESESDKDDDKEKSEKGQFPATSKKAQLAETTLSTKAAIEQLEKKKRLSRAERKKLNQLRRGESIWEKPLLGIFIPGTHDIAPFIDQCPAHHPSINNAIRDIEAAMNVVKTKAYNDTTGDGNLRYVTMTVASHTPTTSNQDMNKVQLTLVWNNAGSDENKPKTFDTPKFEKPFPQREEGLKHIEKNDKELFALVQELLRDRRLKNGGKKGCTSHWLYHSIHINYNNAWSHTNTIYNFDHNSWQHLFGPLSIQEVMPVRDESSMVSDYVETVASAAVASVPALPVFAGSFGAPANNRRIKFDDLDDKPAPIATPAPVVAVAEGKKKKQKTAAKSDFFRPVLNFPPTVFRQANINGFSRIISELRRYIPAHSRIIELYGGVGTIGLHLLDKCQYLICSDENPNNERAFNINVRTLDPRVRHNRAAKYIAKNATDIIKFGCFSTALISNKDFYVYQEDKQYQAKKETKVDAKDETKKDQTKKDVKDKASDLDSFDFTINLPVSVLPPNVCIVDPPRKGLENYVLEALCTPKKAPAKNAKHNADDVNILDRLIYVSCGFKALQRDCQRLVKDGGWKIAHAEGHVLFPGSDHIETLVVFVR